jgi:hypothetical protein
VKKKSKKSAKAKSRGPKRFAYLEKLREKLASEAKECAPKAKALAQHNGLMTLDEAKQHAEQGQALTAKAVENWWTLAAHAIEGLEHGGPQALGLTVTKWYENIYRGAWQMIRRHVEHVKRLKGVPVEDLHQIPDCNAYTMRLLPENLRTSKQWLDAAKNETGEAFTEAVYAKRAELGIQDEAMVKTGTALRLNSIPASLGPLLTDCLKHAAREHDLDLTKKEGKIDAFQVMVMHYHQDFCEGQTEETVEA